MKGTHEAGKRTRCSTSGMEGHVSGRGSIWCLTLPEGPAESSRPAPVGEVFAWLSEVNNLPRYLPPVVSTSIEGPSAEGVPGQRIRTTLEYREGEGTFDSEGYFAVDEGRKRLEWGAEVGRDYSDWLEVARGADRQSQVTVHLSFGEHSVEPKISETSPEDRDPLAEGILATLESIRRQIEEGAGKVKPPPPPPGAGTPSGENPAVVDEDPPSGAITVPSRIPGTGFDPSGRACAMAGHTRTLPLRCLGHPQDGSGYILRAISASRCDSRRLRASLVGT